MSDEGRDFREFGELEREKLEALSEVVLGSTDREIERVGEKLRREYPWLEDRVIAAARLVPRTKIWDFWIVAASLVEMGVVGGAGVITGRPEVAGLGFIGGLMVGMTAALRETWQGDPVANAYDQARKEHRQSLAKEHIKGILRQ